MKKVSALAFVAVLGLAACSSDSSDTEAVTAETEAVTAETEAAPAETEAAPVETEAAPVTEAAPADSAPAAADSAAAAPAEGLTYTLKEWSLEGSAALTAGPQTFTVANGGDFPHEFRILKGTYEEAPKNDLGTVQVPQMAADAQLTLVEKIEPGANATVNVDLPAGNYLFVCNIEFGPNSHAGKGQKLNVTVA